MGAAVPRMHGLVHAKGGPDPIPGLGGELEVEDVGLPTAALGGPHDLAVYSVPGPQTVANGSMRKYVEAAAEVTLVRAALGTAPAGSGLTVRVNVNGALRATVTIPAGANTATGAPSTTSLAAGDYLTFDVTAIGSTTPGSNLTVTVWGRYA